MKKQSGAAMVEFALIALIFFALLLGIIEFSRAMFVWNTLVEATRRGARVAAVCPVSASGINQVELSTIFDTPGDGKSTPLLGLVTDDVAVSYYQADMTPVASPIDSITAAEYDKIAFVQVEIKPSFTYSLFILNPNIFSNKKFNKNLPVPAIKTTLPSESLGRVSSQNPITQRCCFGVCVT